MSKVKIRFQCNNCGAITPKWTGQCPECQAWNSLSETAIEKESRTDRIKLHQLTPPQVRTLDDVPAGEQARSQSGISELDRVLGGGIVGGSVILIGGDPGIGKSTLLIQMIVIFFL